MKMAIVYNAIQQGWAVRKLNNGYEFKIKKEDEIFNIMKNNTRSILTGVETNGAECFFLQNFVKKNLKLS